MSNYGVPVQDEIEIINETLSDLILMREQVEEAITVHYNRACALLKAGKFAQELEEIYLR